MSPNHISEIVSIGSSARLDFLVAMCAVWLDLRSSSTTGFIICLLPMARAESLTTAA
jgi:hypothetical protein